MRRKKPYLQILRRPIAPPSEPEERAKFRAELASALEALLLHYEIDAKGTEIWFHLAFVLMVDHVGAFRKLGGLTFGRPRTRDSRRNARQKLRVEVDKLKDAGRTERATLRLLEERWKRHPKENPFPTPRAFKTLQKDLKVARSEHWRSLAEALLGLNPASAATSPAEGDLLLRRGDANSAESKLPAVGNSLRNGFFGLGDVPNGEVASGQR